MEFTEDALITSLRTYKNAKGYNGAEATLLLPDGNVAKVMADAELAFDEALKGKMFKCSFEVKASKDSRLYVKLVDFVPVK